jgi:hypothetical protein
MTNGQLASKVRAWLKGTDVGPEDVRRSVGMVSGRAEHTRQRGRWWPLPSFRRRAASQAARNDMQLSPIPAAIGHTPTVIGRTSSMFSPVKAITAGAFVFAIGGAFLVAQPLEQQGAGVPGAEAEAIAPTWVTGNVQYAPSCSGPDSEMAGEVRHDWNYECSPQTWTASDPRFTGEVASRWSEDVYRTDNGFVAVNTTVDFLRNDEGGWTCSSSNLYEGSGLFPTQLTGKTATCVGQGGYEGLSAILIEDEADAGHPFVGLIFDGDFPPAPEPPTAE